MSHANPKFAYGAKYTKSPKMGKNLQNPQMAKNPQKWAYKNEIHSCSVPYQFIWAKPT